MVFGVHFYYVCDRAALYMNHWYPTFLVKSTAVSNNKDSDKKMLILKISKPLSFHFYTGQYVYLKVAEVDEHWR